MLDWITSLDLAGTFVFAVSGALAARQERMDLMGMFVLAVTTGAGGGTLRSVFIGAIPPPVFTDPAPVVIALVAAALWLVSGRYLAEEGRRHTPPLHFQSGMGIGGVTRYAEDLCKASALSAVRKSEKIAAT